MANLKLAVRVLLKNPFVTVVGIVSLALGIGANAAIFSLFNQMLLRPLPVPKPQELVNISAPGVLSGSTSCNNAGPCDVIWSYPMFRDLQKAQTSFTGIAAHRLFGANLSARGQTVNSEGLLISGSYFPVLGVTPAVGRLLGPQDDQSVGQSLVAVLSHAYWQRRYGADPNVINEQIIVNGQSLTIVGVGPAGFDGTTMGARPDVFVPITLRGLMNPGFEGFANRRTYWAYLFARLRPGVTTEQAARTLNVPFSQILADVEAPLQRGMSDATLARFKAKHIVLEDGRRGQSSLSRDARAPLNILLGITGLVLLIACANIANLLLARSSARAGEMAVRLSIGASRGQLVRQLLTESILLAVLGGAVGLLVAGWTLHMILATLPAQQAVGFSANIDGTVMLFAAGVSLVTGLLFGMFPAINSTRPDIVSTLKGLSGQPSGATGAKWFRYTLATAQIGLSMLLLITAGLFVKSLYNVSKVDLGLKADNIIAFGISPQLSGYNDKRSAVLFERLEDELATIPGVTGVTNSLVPLISGSNWGNDVNVEGLNPGPDTDTNARFNEVGPEYFKTLGIPLLAGREFTRADSLNAPKVAIVNEAFLKKFNLPRNAVGKRMGYEAGSTSKLEVEIVGVIKDAKYAGVKQEIPPVYYVPYRQDQSANSMWFYLRTAQDPQEILGSVPKVVARLDPNIPLERLRTLPQQIRENVSADRLISTLSTAFAVLATVLAAVGLYGVLAYTIAQRTREFGLRMALGAAPGRVRSMVLRQVGVMTIVGAAFGFAGALYLGTLAESLLFQLKGRDPMVFLASVVLLAVIALAAGIIPAHRASRIDPMTALRYQ
jgi:predicted permease